MREILATLLIGSTLVATTPSQAQNGPAKATYLANEGVMVEADGMRVLFDPLFRYPQAYYQAVPPAMEQALFEGLNPFQHIDAVFISHYHRDHWAPTLILDLLKTREEIHLFAPAQAVAQLRDIAQDADESVFTRVTGVDLEYGKPPWKGTHGDITIEVVMIPHSGWPAPERAAVQNAAWRISLGDAATVVHMGDADANAQHFSQHGEFWASRTTDMAFPPYWLFMTDDGAKNPGRRHRRRA